MWRSSLVSKGHFLFCCWFERIFGGLPPNPDPDIDHFQEHGGGLVGLVHGFGGGVRRLEVGGDFKRV